MSEMIERVARAIKDELARQDGYGPFEFEEGGLELAYLDQGRVDFGKVARIAIAAMLGPTEAMQRDAIFAAGWLVEPSADIFESGVIVESGMSEADAEYNNKACREQAAEIFNAMIDAALKD